MLSQLLRKADTQDEPLRGIKFDITSINPKIKSHFIMIKWLALQFGQVWIQLNQFQKGIMPNDIVQDLKDTERCKMVMTSGKGKTSIVLQQLIMKHESLTKSENSSYLYRAMIINQALLERQPMVEIDA